MTLTLAIENSYTLANDCSQKAAKSTRPAADTLIFEPQFAHTGVRSAEGVKKIAAVPVASPRFLVEHLGAASLSRIEP